MSDEAVAARTRKPNHQLPEIKTSAQAALPRPLRPHAAFLEFTNQIMQEIVLALRTRDGARVRDLRRVNILSYRRYLYSRLGSALDRTAQAGASYPS